MSNVQISHKKYLFLGSGVKKKGACRLPLFIQHIAHPLLALELCHSLVADEHQHRHT